jgi:hypothetical protein
MPLFTRRRLQAMLDDISDQLESDKARDLLARLENKRVDQVLPAEVELALLWALSKVGDLDIEPYWWGDSRRPDAYTEGLIPGEPAVVEIAAPSDNGISGEEDMDRIALQVSGFVGKLERGAGAYLRFHFGEMHGYEGRNYVRRRLAPAEYELTEGFKTKLREWVGSGESVARPLDHVEPGLAVRVERDTYKQTRYHNIFSSMPPEAYSLDDNPLYRLLERKVDQLRAAPEGTHRFIFLGDAGSTLVNRIGGVGEIDPTHRRISGRQILSHFVRTHRQKIESVVVIAPPARANGAWSG